MDRADREAIVGLILGVAMLAIVLLSYVVEHWVR